MNVITRRVDLPHTTMEDFIEHFENDFRKWPEMFLDGLGEPWAHFGARLENKVRTLEGRPLKLHENLPREAIVRWDKELEPPLDRSKYVTIDVHRVTQLTKTERGYQIQVEQEWLLQLNIIRYRHDRLRLILTEFGDQEVHIPKVAAWLKHNWGVELDPPGQEKEGPETPSQSAPGRKRDAWNQKAIDRLMAGEEAEEVRKKWRHEYEAGAKQHPSKTSDGEDKTWRKRVWNPYRKVLKRGA